MHLSRYLNYNQITSIASGAFIGLGSMTFLCATLCCQVTNAIITWYARRTLQVNLITSIPSNAFTGLGSLTYLYAVLHINIAACLFHNWSCRNMGDNLITSISSGAFAGIGNLTFLYVLLHCLASSDYIHAIMQVSDGEPDHVDCQWRIYWTWKPDWIVRY